MRVFSFALLFVFFAPITALTLLAQTPAPSVPVEVSAEVAVAAVKFSPIRFGSDTWVEAEIELAIRPGGKTTSGEFVDRVRTTLSLAYEPADTANGGKLKLYRASAEAITLEAGKAYIRFYLPPEVVKRDRLRAEPKYYVAEVEVAGKVQPLTRGAFVTATQTADAVKNFQNAVNAEAGVNDGVLMAQYLTPFAPDTRRPTPTFLRREAQR